MELYEDFSWYAIASVYELDRKLVLYIDMNGLTFSNRIFMNRGDGFHHLPTLYPLQRLWNVFKINLILVHHISDSRINKEAHLWTAFSIQTHTGCFFYGLHQRYTKQVFLRNFSIHYTFILHPFIFHSLIVLRYLSRLCVVPTRVWFLCKFWGIWFTSSLVICFKNN